jgi:hypothetical protein
MGNKDSTSNPKPVTTSHPTAGSKGGSMQTEALPSSSKVAGTQNPKHATPVNLAQSLARAVVALLFRSERMLALAKDEVDFGEPLKAAPRVPSIETLKKIREGIILFESTGEASEAVKCIDELAKTTNQTPAEALFNILNSGLKILKFNCKQPVQPLPDAIEAFIKQELNFDSTDVIRVLKALAADLEKVSPGLNNSSKSATELQNQLREVIISNKGKLTLKNLPRTLQATTPFLYESLDGDSPFEHVLVSIREAVNFEAREKVYDSNLILATSNNERVVGFRNFNAAINLNFGFAPFATQNINPRVKMMKIQVHREPDVLDLYFLEAFTGVHIDGCKTYSDPNSHVVSKSSNIVDKLAICEPSVDIKADYDCLTVFNKDRLFFYCLKNGQVFGQDITQSNLLTLNLHLVKEPLINTLDTLKVVFVPKSTLIAKNYYYMIIFKKGDTLKVLKEYIEKNFSETLGSTATQQLEKIRTALIFANECYGAQSDNKKIALKTSQAFLKSKGWDTPIEALVSNFGQKDRKITEVGQNRVDLVISLASKLFTWNLEPNNLRREIRRQPIYLKAQLSDLWQQIYDNYFSSSGDELTELDVRMMLPSYLYVSLDNVARMIDVPYELNLNSIEGKRKEFDLEISSRYRAIGFIAQKRNGEYYTIYVNPQNRNEVYSYLGNKKMACQMHALNPNKIKAVYYERREREI